MLRYFKIRLARTDREADRLWVPVAAKSVGEAVVKADEAFMDMPYRICDFTAAEIPREEFVDLLQPCDLQQRLGPEASRC